MVAGRGNGSGWRSVPDGPSKLQEVTEVLIWIVMETVSPFWDVEAGGDGQTFSIFKAFSPN